MTRIGLKLWNINTQNYLGSAIKLFKDGLFDYIELYIVPNHLQTLSEWRQLSIPFIIHAPHSMHKMNLSKKDYASLNLCLYEETKHYADVLRAKHIIFHGGVDGDYKETAHQLSAFNDRRILIENKPYTPLPRIDGNFYVGSSVSEVAHIMKTAQCGFCLDIGHATAAAKAFNICPYEHIAAFIELHPVMLHLSDITLDSELDEHLNYGQGNLDFPRLFEMLPQNIPITIETHKQSETDLDDFILDTIKLKSFFP